MPLYVLSHIDIPLEERQEQERGETHGSIRGEELNKNGVRSAAFGAAWHQNHKPGPA